MIKLIEDNSFILMEAAVAEPMVREHGIPMHPSLFNAPAIYDPKSRAVMKAIYQSYIDVAYGKGVPILLLTPTWRANRERVGAQKSMSNVNFDAVDLMNEIRTDQGGRSVAIRIGGLIGCKNDAYDPSQGLSCIEAQGFHQWQVDQLARAKVDFLIAETIPSIEEAKGIAKAMARTGLPYFISFVVNRRARLLDETTLARAIDDIDGQTRPSPTGYLMNCAYPAFLRAREQPARLFQRLVGCQANASSLDHDDLDGSEEQLSESVDEWGREMVTLHRSYGMKMLGGCCGTRKEHLEYLARNIPT